MKSKIKTIFLILIIIVLAAVYAVIDKPVSVYDTSCDTSKFQAQVLEVGQMASQKFVCEEAYMDGISLKLAANAVPGTENLGKLRSGKFFKMKFDRVNDCKDKAYTLNFQVTKCDAGNVQIFYTPGTDKGEALVYAGTPIDGIGVMRTLTHRFDLETYIVTLCFAAYIVLFMRWLYKLFK